MTPAERAEIIKQRLTHAFSPNVLELLDHSASHAGHAGNTGGGHYQLKIKSPAFEGKSTLESHRLVYGCLQDLIPQEIHALSISIVN